MIHFVLLSGGSGTRLWPLSNDARSKQFLKVLRNDAGEHVSMVQRVFEQLSNINQAHDVTIATCESQRDSIARQIHGSFNLVLEPTRRDTAPAIMLACSYLLDKDAASPQDTVIVMPIDTFADQSFYDKAADLSGIIQDGKADLALLGVKPLYPSTKYGYMVPDKWHDTYGMVGEFVEKPSLEAAEKLIDEGALWNCGVFAFKLAYLERITKQYVDNAEYENLLKRYGVLPKNSFDYEVVEKARSIGFMAYEGSWSDLGTWNTLSDEMVDVAAGRVVLDDMAERDNVHVINETGLPLVVAGMKDAIIVVTPDGMLVSSKEESVNLKGYVDKIAHTRPMYEQRRWGEYRVLNFDTHPGGSKSLVKELIIDSGKQLSYQSHRDRSELWNVVSGTGEVVLENDVIPISTGSIITIEKGVRHSCRAFNELHIIEVQLGETLVENDVERFGNYWQEAEKPKE